MTPAKLERPIEGLVVLVADSTYMRRMTRTMLVNLGVRSIYEAQDGIAALDATRTVSPDGDMPELDGPEVMRIIRMCSPSRACRSSCSPISGCNRACTMRSGSACTSSW